MQHQYSIQLAHARPTMHRIRLVCSIAIFHDDDDDDDDDDRSVVHRSVNQGDTLLTRNIAHAAPSILPVRTKY